MKNTLLMLILISFVISCTNNSTNLKTVEISQEGVKMEIPEGWFFDESVLFDQDTSRVGEFMLGAIEPSPQINCKEFIDRYVNEGEDIDSDKGGYGFERATGGDVCFENVTSETKEINGRKIYRANSNVTSFGEGGKYKGVSCSYCVQLAKNKLFLFDFYFDETPVPTFGLSDTIMSSVELINK